jgi:hypothetical protein
MKADYSTDILKAKNPRIMYFKDGKKTANLDNCIQQIYPLLLRRINNFP